MSRRSEVSSFQHSCNFSTTLSHVKGTLVLDDLPKLHERRAALADGDLQPQPVLAPDDGAYGALFDAAVVQVHPDRVAYLILPFGPGFLGHAASLAKDPLLAGSHEYSLIDHLGPPCYARGNDGVIMSTFPEVLRKTTTLLLAVFLWLHGLFVLNISASHVAGLSRVLRLTTSEAVLFVLLVVFTFVSASGFWKQLRSMAYIYFFPFVALGYCLYFVFIVMRGLHRWFTVQALNAGVIEATTSSVVPSVATPPVTTAPVAGGKVSPRQRAKEVLSFLLRPFRRFMTLWCVLLLVTTHKWVVWLCLVVVLAHLAQKIFLVLKSLLFSGPLLKRLKEAQLTVLDKPLAALATVVIDATSPNELRNLWNQFIMWRKVFDFLKNPYLLSRWAWTLGIVFIGSLYLYFALFFSVAYYGLARVSGIDYPWSIALVDSVFIPFAYNALPHVLWIRLLGGLQATITVAIGIGTIVKFLARRLDAVRQVAAELSDRLLEPVVQEKLQSIEAKIAAFAPASPTPPTPTSSK